MEDVDVDVTKKKITAHTDIHTHIHTHTHTLKNKNWSTFILKRTFETTHQFFWKEWKLVTSSSEKS